MFASLKRVFGRRRPETDRSYLRQIGEAVGTVEDAGDGVVQVTPRQAPHHPIFIRRDLADPSILEEIFVAKHYSLDETRIAKRLDALYQRIAKDHVPLILDLGANVGYATVFYARRYPKSVIVSVECDAENFRWLTKNTERFPSVLPMHTAVDSMSGRQLAVTDRDAESASSIYRSCRYIVASPKDAHEDAERISTCTVPELIALAKQHQPTAMPFLCKFDIEGHERDLFLRNTEWVQEFHVLIGEGHDHIFPGRKTAHGMLRTAMQYGFDITVTAGNFLAVRY